MSTQHKLTLAYNDINDIFHSPIKQKVSLKTSFSNYEPIQLSPKIGSDGRPKSRLVLQFDDLMIENSA